MRPQQLKWGMTVTWTKAPWGCQFGPHPSRDTRAHHDHLVPSWFLGLASHPASAPAIRKGPQYFWVWKVSQSLLLQAFEHLTPTSGPFLHYICLANFSATISIQLRHHFFPDAVQFPGYPQGPPLELPLAPWPHTMMAHITMGGPFLFYHFGFFPLICHRLEAGTPLSWCPQCHAWG